MPNVNQIVPWATGGGASVLTPAAYSALATRPGGFAVGIVDPATFNTILRQASFVASVIAQFTADFGPANVNDDGNIGEMQLNFVNAMIANVSQGQVVYTDTGTADALAIAPVPAIGAYAAGQAFWVKKGASPNATTTPTISVSGMATKTIVKRDGTALVAADLPGGMYMFLYYDGTHFLVLEPTLQSTLAAGAVIGIASFMRGSLTGAVLSNDVSLPNTTLDIASYSACSDDFTTLFAMSSATTKLITATFVAGAGAGGLDTGTVAASTFYFVWAIYNPSTLASDVLLSLSPTAPTLPSGYTKKRRIRGAIKTDGSSHIIAFTQAGRVGQINWNVAVQDQSTVTVGTAISLFSLASIPSAIAVVAIVRVTISKSAASPSGLIATPTETSTASSPANNTNIISDGAGLTGVAQVDVPTATGQVALSSNTASTIFNITTAGFVDTSA